MPGPVSQGSNVQRRRNLHLWYPLQKEPATDWEARIDYLYNEGQYELRHEKAKIIWDEYQSIILEQCPLIYLVRSRAFYAIRNEWVQDSCWPAIVLNSASNSENIGTRDVDS
ncbi:hypothetical protein [Treponema parvum]|uniref:hypothetical protein n=1 Tax=Treponema parvum TaxID=138851 RepID=UPI001AEC61D2|nr:hypothetical protein [Treponema parvum]QTQ16577.1 hypothetical protein HXT04_07675 [Treponema parvum]